MRKTRIKLNVTLVFPVKNYTILHLFAISTHHLSPNSPKSNHVIA